MFSRIYLERDNLSSINSQSTINNQQSQQQQQHVNAVTPRDTAAVCMLLLLRAGSFTMNCLHCCPFFVTGVYSSTAVFIRCIALCAATPGSLYNERSDQARYAPEDATRWSI